MTDVAAQHSERRFRALVEHSADGIALMSPDGMIHYANPALTPVLGYPVEDFVGRNALDLIHPDERAAFAAALQRMVGRPGQTRTFHFRFRHQDQSYRWLEGMVTHLADDPDVGALVVNYHDVTAHRERERELEAMASVGATLRGALTRADMIPLLLDHVAGLTNADGVAVVRPGSAMGETVVEAARGQWAPWSGQTLPPSAGITRQTIASNEAYVNNEVVAPSFPGRGALLAGLSAVTCLPLVADGENVGALWVGRRSAFADHEVRVLRLLAEIAAGALQRGALYEQMTERLREFEAVGHISGTLRVAQNMDDMLAILLDETLTALNATAGSIALYHSESDELRPTVSRRWLEHLAAATPTSAGVAGQVFTSGQPFVSHEFASDSSLTESERAAYPRGWGGACVPIRTARETVGVLFVIVEQPRQLQPAELRVLTTMTEIAGNAIHRMSLHNQTVLHLQRMAALHAVDVAISASLDLNLILNLLLGQVTTQLQVDAACILLLNAHTLTLDYGAGVGFRSNAIAETHLWLGEGYAGRAALERRNISIPRLTEGTDTSARRALIAREGFVTYHAVPLVAKGQVQGVLEIFHRSYIEPDPEWVGFLEALARQAAIAIDNASLFERLQRTNAELALAYDTTLEGWSKALDLRDEGTEGHTLRVTEMTLRLARALGVAEADLVHIRRGALLHDIGKMGIPDRILLKPGPLNDEEWAVMRQHPIYAYDMLSSIPHLRQALDIPYAHHEKWDGSGYPRGLRGEHIPMAARIFAVADVWDALSSDRPYRKAWPRERVLEHIRSLAGAHFDPRVVDTFVNVAPWLTSDENDTPMQTSLDRLAFSGLGARG